MSDHPIRTLMANVSAAIFQHTVDPLLNIPNTISSVVLSASSGSGDAPVIGAALGTLSSTMVTVVKAIGTALKPTGYALCALFFIISLLELAMSERMTLEYFVKYFSKLAIGVAAVSLWDEIFDKVRDLGSILSSFISDIPVGSDDPTASNTIDFQATFQEFVGTTGAGSWIMLIMASILFGAIFLFASFIVVGIVYVIAMTWLLEFCIRGAFLPIACALLSDDGWRGAGGRYIRKFLGVSCQGACMVAIGKLLSFGMVGALDSVLSDFGGKSVTEDFSYFGELASMMTVFLALSIAGVSVMQKSASIVSDVFGG